jgi:hypothetical protein
MITVLFLNAVWVYKTQRFILISHPLKNLQTHAKKIISEKVTESTNIITINLLNAVYLLLLRCGKVFDLKLFSVYFFAFFPVYSNSASIFAFYGTHVEFLQKNFMGYTVLALFAKFKADLGGNAGGGGGGPRCNIPPP